MIPPSIPLPFQSPHFALYDCGRQGNSSSLTTHVPVGRGPLGASQRASLPATSGAGEMEWALFSGLKVNEAAAPALCH